MTCQENRNKHLTEQKILKRKNTVKTRPTANAIWPADFNTFGMAFFTALGAVSTCLNFFVTVSMTRFLALK